MNAPRRRFVLAPARPDLALHGAPAGVPRRGFLARMLGLLGLGALAARPGRAAPVPKSGYGGSPFIGEVLIVGFDFAPPGWLPCNGQLLPIGSYPDLYNLIGTTYGGDGQNTFGLPNLNGRAPVHMGFGPGGSNRILGEAGGVEVVTLTANQMPSHGHTMRADAGLGVTDTPAGGYPARNAAGLPVYKDDPSALLGGSAIDPAGGNQAHANMQPYLAVNFIIAHTGTYPIRA